MKILIVVDMQNDFVDGNLGTAEAMEIIPNVFSKIEEYRNLGDIKEVSEVEPVVVGNCQKEVIFTEDNDKVRILFTQDTHHVNTYITSEEGKKLPVYHCLIDGNRDAIKGGKFGWDLIPEFDYFKKYGTMFYTLEKDTFGSEELLLDLQHLDDEYGVESVELIGLCTDMCVITNAMIAKTALPNVPIYVDASCCAGSDLRQHKLALELMEKSLQINIINKDNDFGD